MCLANGAAMLAELTYLTDSNFNLLLCATVLIAIGVILWLLYKNGEIGR